MNDNKVQQSIYIKPFFTSLFFASLTFLGLAYYFIETNWSTIELLKFTIGCVALWLPLGSLLYVKFKYEIEDKIIRFTFSFIASYTITTLLYFIFSMFNIINFFYITEVSILVYVLLNCFKNNNLKDLNIHFLKNIKIDWILASLISLSLVVNACYQLTWKYSSETNQYTLNLYTDQLYYTSQVYELQRHTPPLQSPTKAGAPERAYHMFPHLTTLLIAKFTGQADVLRASLAYHYDVITFGICLAFYSIVKLLTKNIIASYIAVSSVFITSVEYPVLRDNYEHQLGFFLFPHGFITKSALVISPQASSGLLVLYGVFLGILLISIGTFYKKTINLVLIITGIMVSSTLRFRVLEFIPMFPAFIIVCLYSLFKIKRKIYLITILLTLVVSIVLYHEMSYPIYATNSTKIHIAFNGLTDNMKYYLINQWPFSRTLNSFVGNILGDTVIKKWVWQIISTNCFIFLNIVGIPMCINSAIYFFSNSARREYLLFSSQILLMVFFAILGGMLLSLDYDEWSLGGQISLYPGWYLFILMGPALFIIYENIKHGIDKIFSKSIQLLIIFSFIVFFLIINLYQEKSSKNLQNQMIDTSVTLSINGISALNYIHNKLPQNSVILYHKYIDKYMFLESGIAGKPAYLEDGKSPFFNRSMLDNYHLQDRRKLIKDLWLTSDNNEFCQLISHAKPTTHILEFSDHPFLVNNPYCLRLVKSFSTKNLSYKENVNLWKIINE